MSNYKALGSTFIPCSKSYNQTRLGLELQINRNSYTKRIKISMENIKLSSRNIPRHHHRSIGSLHVLLPSYRQTSYHNHRQRLTLTISTNASPLLDLVTFSRLFIDNHPHRQLPCRPVTVVPSADLFFTDSWVRVKKRRQHMPPNFGV